ncbi:MAG: TonB-dependent receptor [Chitinophagaceae bacterium]|nr:TonB-dependent receptor [Chitinophagaceae bacterium]
MKKKMFFVAAVIISSSALAQEDSASKNLDEVIVTANRLQQKQSQTGKVVTVIGKDVLERNQGRTVAQVLNEQAGITINGALNNAGSVQTVYMRGANSGRVLVLMDGIPVGDPSFINNEFDLNFFSVNDVERIEIARGAQSTLYGSDAVAGVINIITVKQNVKKPFNLKSTLSGGNLSTFRGNVQLYGKAGKLTYQTRFSSVNTKGFSAAYDSTGKQGFDRDGYNGIIANASVQYQATNQLSFRSFIQHSAYKSDVDGGAFRDDKDFTINNRNFTTGAGFQFKNDAVAITGNYQYSENKRNFLNDSGSISGFAKYVRDDYFSKSQFAELFATVKLSKSFTLLQGADYRFGSYNSQFLSISSFGPFSNQFRDTSVSQSSLYASLIYASANKKLNVELGGRLNVHSRYGSNYTYTFNPSYAITDKWRVFGSIATGFKAPGLYQLYSGFGDEDLKPEESKNYEIGIQNKAGKLTHRLVYFYRDIKNGIDFDNVKFKYFNFPEQIVRGLEYEAAFAISKSWQVSGNYTYLNGTDYTQSRITFKDTAYSYLLRRPAHSFNLAVNYKYNDVFFVSVNARYVSERFDVTDFKKPDAALKGYFLLNANASYTINRYFKVFAEAQNIGNTKFFDLRGFNSIPFLISGGITLHL